MSEKFPQQIHVSEIKLADTVMVFGGEWGYAIVTQITEDEIIMTRPYGTTADFSYTGGVIFYTGQEICRYRKDDSRFQYFDVWARKDLR